MSSSEDDVVAAYMFLRRKKKSKRKFWVHPFYRANLRRSSYIVAQDLSSEPVKFQGFYRLSKETFQELVELLSYRALKYYFMRGLTTISNIITTTTEAIWTTLQPQFMSIPTPEKWATIADRYEKLWNVPNCLCSLDGKHFRIKCPPRTGSQFYNYKRYFSIVLMACADADGLFTTIDVGEIDRNSNGAVFRSSNLGRALQLGLLQLPQPKPLPSIGGDDFPYFFVADLTQNVLWIIKRTEKR